MSELVACREANPLVPFLIHLARPRRGQARNAHAGAAKPFGHWTKPLLTGDAVIQKRIAKQQRRSWSNGRGPIMWGLISSIYRAYCHARLLEMRSNHRHAGHA